MKKIIKKVSLALNSLASKLKNSLFGFFLDNQVFREFFFLIKKRVG